VHTSGAFATATLEVSSVAQVSSVDIVKLVDDGKELVAGSGNPFYLALALKDQYGNSVLSTTYAKEDLIVTVTNPTAATVDGYASNSANFHLIDSNKVIALKLGATLAAGTSTVTLISKVNGAKDSFDVVVKENVHVDTLALTAPASAPAGATVEIPFTAVDQFGAAIANPSNGQVNSISVTNGTYQGFVKDIVKGTTSFKVTLGAKGTTIVTVITKTNKVAQLSINVTDAKTPTVISGVKDIDTAFLVGGSATLDVDNVVVKDQYGNDIDLPTGYGIKVATSDSSKVSSSLTTTPSVLKAEAKGSSSITLTLTKGSDDVANSSYTYTTKVVDKADIKSYTATVAGTVYKDSDSKYFKALNVKGTLEDGSTVSVPNHADNYVVNVNSGIVHTGGKINASATTVTFDKNEAEVTILVVVKGASAETIPVTFKVSDALPKATTLSLKDGTDGTKKESDGVVSAYVRNVDTVAKVQALAKAVVKVEDQYGAALTHDGNITDDASIIISNVSNGHEVEHATKNVVAEDTFTVTLITKNGKHISFKVIVKANPVV